MVKIIGLNLNEHSKISHFGINNFTYMVQVIYSTVVYNYHCIYCDKHNVECGHMAFYYVYNFLYEISS